MNISKFSKVLLVLTLMAMATPSRAATRMAMRDSAITMTMAKVVRAASSGAVRGSTGCYTPAGLPASAGYRGVVIVK